MLNLPFSEGATTTSGGAAFTTGSIPFGDGNGLTQDNSNLFWDDTNNLLGLGSATPDSALHIRQGVKTTGSPTALRVVGGAHTTLTASVESPTVVLDASATVQFATGALATQRAVRIAAPTYGFVGASTITDAVTLYVSGPPAAGANATITNAYAVWIDSGNVRIDGSIIGANGTTLTETSGVWTNSGMYIAATTGFRISGAMELTVNASQVNFDAKHATLGVMNLQTASVTRLSIDNSGDITHTQGVSTSGSPTAFTVTGAAHTTLATTVEAIGVNINMSATKQFATGAIATQREVVIQAPTYGFVGASTITDAATFYISGAPIAGTNATLTNTYAIWVDSGITRLDGALNGAAGTAALPGVSVGNTGYGMYYDGGTILGFSTAGASRMTLDNSTAIVRSTFAFRTVIGTAQAVYAEGTGATIRCDGTGANAFSASVGGFTVAQGIITQVAATTGAPQAFLITPAAHTTLTGEAPSITLATASQQWASASGTQALLRAVVFNAPTYDMDGAATITTAITLDISGVPITGASAAMTNRYGVRINNATVAAGALTTSASLYVVGAPQDPAGGTSRNVSAILVGGTATVRHNNAAFNYSLVNIPAHTLTLTATTQVTSSPAVAGVRINTITVTDASAVTLDTCAALYIAAAPTAAGSVTMTNTYAIWVDDGNIRADGLLYMSDGAAATPAIANTTYTTTGFYWTAGPNISVATGGAERTRWSSSGMAMLSGNIFLASGISMTNTGDSAVFINFGGTGLTLTPVVRTSGNHRVMTATGAAHTNQTLSTEEIDVLWDLSRTVQFATGALALQRSIVFDVQTTYGFVGASALTTAVGLHITSGPTQGANATFTRAITVAIGGTQASPLTTATTTLASAAGAAFKQMIFFGDIVAMTGTTQVTGSPSIAGLELSQLTINGDTATLTIDNVATLYIAGAPIQGTNITLTNTYAIWVDTGLVRFDGNGTVVLELPADATDPTGGGGAAAGRIPVKIGGATKYLAYY